MGPITTSIILGGIKIPKVPPAVIVPAASLTSYPDLFIDFEAIIPNRVTEAPQIPVDAATMTQTNTHAKKNCLLQGNEILNQRKKDRILNSLNKADLIIFNSNYIKNKTIKNFKILKKIDHKIIHPAFVEKIFKSKIIKNKYDLCTVARLEYRKGHHLVFEAMSILRNKYDIILKYAILGDGPELSRLKDLVIRHSFHGKVSFINQYCHLERILKN